ncbi:hypothetical protein [Methylobacterium bullatum]|uniref:Uncharacterized protein n=1 Tax=Methylobacterium bullatum TaxID=570505 RepID=A0A679K0R3_9HYPH|nr:hypothetical protein MBLL_04724 [Methylobacterium bullatum]
MNLAFPLKPAATGTQNPHNVAAATEERARCQFIVTSPHAVGREAFAIALATKTDMAPQDAVDLLASLPGPAAASATAAADVVCWDDVAASLNEARH